MSVCKQFEPEFVQYLLDTFECDFSTGKVYRKVATSKRKSGAVGTEVPSHPRKNGSGKLYHRINFTFKGKQKMCNLSRIVFILFHRRDVRPGYLLDHCDLDSLNDTMHPVENIRELTPAENLMNTLARAGGTSKFKGVHLDKSRGKYRAQIHINGKQKKLGWFDTEEAAARSYDIAALETYGTVARINFLVSDYPNITLPKRKSSAYRGVMKSGKKYVGQFRYGNERIYAGSFENPADAFAAVQAMRQGLGLKPYPEVL